MVISVIIPTYNGEKRLVGCLDSIINQDYPRDNLELLVVNDASEDGTVAVAEKYGARVLTNGSRNIERGKSIGLQNATGELVFLIDDDNRLPSPDWLSRCVAAMNAHPEAVGAEAIYFSYNRRDPVANRYCSLFGINDPLAYYLNKRDRLTHAEKRWSLGGKVLEETPDYYLVQFTKDNLLTVGSQGFLTRRELLLQTIYAPYLFHIDSNLDLVNAGHDTFLMMKLYVIHQHSDTISHLLKKSCRNLRLFLEQSSLRRYRWKTNYLKFLLVVVSMMTFVRPLYDSCKGYRQKPDSAWFLHPVLCFATVVMYGTMVITWYARRLLHGKKEVVHA
ncbi:glycosyltransferase family 2 protein [Chloroflexota bacterium]